MDRGRPTRLSSKSGCGGERTVKAWPHRWLGAGVPAPLLLPILQLRGGLRSRAGGTAPWLVGLRGWLDKELARAQGR